MSNSITNEHPYSARSQSQVVNRSTRNPSSNKENARPQTVSNTPRRGAPKKPIFAKKTQPSTSNTTHSNAQNVKKNQKTTTYDQQAYLNKNVYPTLRKPDKTTTRGILKKKPSQHKSLLDDRVKWSNENAISTNEQNTEALKRMKFFSGSTKSIKYLTKKFHEASKETKLKHVGTFAFEIVAILDSSISESGAKYSKEFTVRDNFDRMHCIYFEMDQTLKKLIRGSFIRLSGLYNAGNSLFTCYSVRQATEHETFSHEQYVNVSNSYIKNTYL